MPHWPDTTLDAFRQQTDPPADAAVAALADADGPDATRALFDMLIDHIELPDDELPPAVRAFLRAHRSLPDWADADLIQRSEAFFLDHGPKVLLALYFNALPTLYACANGAQVLVGTGRLQRDLEGLDRFSRRIAETGQFVLHVMAPGGIAAGGPAVDTVLRVRLIHAAIRHFIGHGNWDPAFGRPINQEDMAITLMTFAVAPLDVLHRFRVDTLEVDQVAFLHHWKVIGHLLGVDARLLPATVADGRALMDRILDRQAAPSDAGVLLGDALVDFTRKAFRWSPVARAAEGFVRYLNPERIEKAIGFDARRGVVPWLVPRAAGWWFRTVELFEKAIPGLDRRTDALSRHIVNRLVGYFDAYKKRDLALPDAMATRWHIDIPPPPQSSNA